LTRKRLTYAALAALLLGLAILATVLVRERVRRRTVFRPAGGGEVKTAAPAGIPPVAQWTQAFQLASAEELDTLLDSIEVQHRDLYAKWSLGYLHARALVETNDKSDAAAKLAPYLAKGQPFRDRALYQRSQLADDEEASRFRTLLILDHPDSIYREQAIDEELDFLGDAGDPKRLADFVARVTPSASTARRREMSARIVEALATNKQLDEAFTRGVAVLRGDTADDAADRVARALDRPEILARLDTPQLVLFGDTFSKHRRFDRAAAVLQLALHRVYSDSLQFDLGRAYFGGEKFAEAQAAYLRGANATKNAAQKTTFLWHAARAAQLAGDDATAERLMTAAIAVKGKFPSTLPALTQRLRTRLHQHRYAEAAADLVLLRKLAGNDRAVLEGSLAYAVAMIAANQNVAALSTLNAIPPKLAGEHDRPELAYWRGRALESRDPAGAVRAYLDVLRTASPFAAFARERVPKLPRDFQVRDAQVAKLIAAKQFDLARSVQTDRVLLSTNDRDAQLAKLEQIYRELPAYRDVLALAPEPFPRFPDVDANDPSSLLMAMGLFDEATPAIEARWPLLPARAALTRSYGLNLGGDAKPSIYAIEVMMKRVPDDFEYALLPRIVRDLLYPRYFRAFIAEDAKKYEVDPAIVFAIMREESRFDPRAKSQAAARGLLQFIITTARDIGRGIGLLDVDPEDLYDPRIIISLGAKYMSELSGQFDGNRYRIAAAYNAGPKQVALWTRLQPAPGDDYFVTAVSFDETKGYVRKVMGSWERYSR
jgi:soluble lytic murein transglycosylase-like protein